MWLRSCWVSLLLYVSGVPLAAGMHKCVDADGNVTYSQTACEQTPGGAKPGRSVTARADTAGVGAGQGDVLCERVRAFALELAEAMREGVGLDRAVAILTRRPVLPSAAGPYGGTETTRRRRITGDDVLEVINHVFAFAGRGAVDSSRIADSAAQQCLRGRFDFARGAPGSAAGLRLAAGSGILLNPQGMVLTAERLVADCRGLRVYDDGTWRDAGLLRRDPPAGLAVLVAEGLRGRPAVLTDGSASPQSQLFAATLPLRGVLSAAVSIVDAAVAAAGDGDPAAADGARARGAEAPAGDGHWALSLPEGSAQWGAPLLGSGGLVVGIALPDDEGGARALPAAALRDFLSAADLPFYSAAALGELTREEVRRRAAGLTVHVECMP